MEAQGYKIDDNVLYQDNQSAMLLEKNGRGSSGKRTRHINVRYFFIADRVKSKEIRLEYCPTGIMVADYFTKPLQGQLFHKLRDMIMGKTDIPLPADTMVPSKTITEGIQAVKPPPQSRSVLKIESESEKVSGVLTRLTGKYMGTSRTETRPVRPLTCLQPCRRANKINVAIIPPRCDKNNERRVLPLANRHSVSWSDIAKRAVKRV